MARKRIQLKRREGVRAGVVTVETAFVLPIIFALFMAAIDFSRANDIRNTLDNACFEAARSGTLTGATEADVKAVAQTTLDILSINNAVITVEPSVIAMDTPQISVTIAVPMSSNLYVGSNFMSGKTMTKSCTLTREQFAVELLQ